MSISKEITECNKQRSEYYRKHENDIEDLSHENCEHDCKYLCSGCGKTFHEVKDEFDCKHNEELPEALQLNCGDYYCHSDCLRDSR